MACVLAFVLPAASAAQDGPPVPNTATEAPGFVPEPALIWRVALFADRHLGKGDLTNGYYPDLSQAVPGTKLSIGPGYRHWYKKDAVFVDGSAVLSLNNSRRLQARLELPKIARSRIEAGVQARWQDSRDIPVFESGSLSLESSKSEYRLRGGQIASYVKFRPVKWMALGVEASRLTTKISDDPDRHFVPVGVSFTIDGRDFIDNPTRGGLLRASATKFDGLEDGTFDFTQYEGQAAGFLPIADGRIVLAVHGWAVTADEFENVPFYLQPSIGGPNTLRSFAANRFRDRNMLVTNAELRFALMTHMQLAVFADAGNVAPRVTDLNLDHRSYGVGLRLHTRRQTFAVVDAAHGHEGWRVFLRLEDPLSLSRLLRRGVRAPFVPWGGMR